MAASYYSYPNLLQIQDMSKSLNLALLFMLKVIQYEKWTLKTVIFVIISKNKLAMSLIVIGTSCMPGFHTHALMLHSYATSAISVHLCVVLSILWRGKCSRERFGWELSLCTCQFNICL